MKKERIRRVRNKILISSIFLLSIFILMPCNVNAAVKVNAERIEIKGSNNLIGGGNSASYSATVFPKTATNKNVIWSVYPEGSGVTITQKGVLKVNLNCKLKEVQVIAKSADDNSVMEKMNVTINPSGISKIALTDKDKKAIPKTINLYRVKVTDCTPVEYQLKPNITWKSSENETNKQPYEFSSTDESIATVDQKGRVKVTGEKTGKCTIKCVAIDGSKNQNGVIQATAAINVTNPISGIKLSIPEGRTTSVAEGRTIQISAKQMKDYGAVSDKSITYTTDNTTVATVNAKGLVTFHTISPIPVTITATVNDETKVSESMDFLCTHPIFNIQMGEIPISMMGNKNPTILTVTDEPVAYKLGFNMPNPDDIKKSVSQELIVTSSMPEYLNATYSKGVLYLWPRKEMTKQTILITISAMDGSNFSKSWAFKISKPEK